MSETLRSESIGSLAAALAVAQGEITDALKDSENPYFRSSYADLASVWRACRAALAKNGLAVVQTTEPTPDRIVLRTTLAHTSGEWMAGLYPIRPMRQVKEEGWVPSDDPQSWGSAITYARRYALAALVGVAPAEDDDDGEQATGRAKPVEKRSDGSALVVSVDEKKGQSKNGKPWTRYMVTFDDGRSGSTFDGPLAAAARNLMETQTLAAPVLEQDGQYTNLISIAPAQAHAVDHETGEVLETAKVLGKDGKEHDPAETISGPDRQFIWAVAKKGKHTEEGVRAILAEFGYEKTEQVRYGDLAPMEQRLKGGGGTT